MDVVIGGLLTLAGALIGAAFAGHVARTERDVVALAEKRRAYGVFLGALFAAVGQLREMPALTPFQEAVIAVSKAVQGEARHYVQSQRGVQRTFGDRPRALADSVAAAYAHLLVLGLPADVQAAADEGLAYVERLAENLGDETIKVEWPSVHRRLVGAAAGLQNPGGSGSRSGPTRTTPDVADRPPTRDERPTRRLSRRLPELSSSARTVSR